jgi:hypothetical protein
MFNFFKKPLILTYSSRRGGSTLLAQILEAAPHVGYVDQPFDLWKPNTKRGGIIANYLPEKDRSQFFELNEQERIAVKKYLNHLYQRKLQILCSNPKAKQLVLKIVNAHGLVDELPKLVPSKSVMMLRHPFSQALSVIRNGWGTCETPFLESASWSEAYLTSTQKEFSNQIITSGSSFDKAVLNWCLEWLYPTHFSKTDVLKLYYEDLVLKGEDTIETLYDYLGFNNPEYALKILHKPSNSSSFSTSNTLKRIKTGDSKALLSDWRKHLSASDLTRGQEILTMFNMKMYTRTSDIPTV